MICGEERWGRLVLLTRSNILQMLGPQLSPSHRSVSGLGLAALHGQCRTEGRMNDEKKQGGKLTEEESAAVVPRRR